MRGASAAIMTIAAAISVVAAAPTRLSGQEGPVVVADGVELGLLYAAPVLRNVVVRGFVDARGAQGEASRVESIVYRDLDLSDRFAVRPSPAERPGVAPDYGTWEVLGADFVVDGTVTIQPGGLELRLTVHDVVYRNLLEEALFALPPASSASFRMAVHAVSDQIVTWITGEPGMAASRVVFPRARQDGGYDIVMVDSDGEGEQRLARRDRLAFSPAWSPDGGAIAYTAMTSSGTYDVLTIDLADGGERNVTPRSGLVMTPAWSPDGSALALAISVGSREDLHEYDPTSGRFELIARNAIEPSYAPDGERVVFSSDRLGTSQVWIAQRAGGNPALLSPWASQDRNSYHAPDWSPDGGMVAFHGGRSLRYQILVADPDGGRTPRQITWEGWSEAPSWAPDARHLVVHGSREGREGLYVIDSATGRTRLLVEGSAVRTPDWSPGPGR